MADVIRQAWHIARKEHACYLCGHAIDEGDEYQAVTFANGYRDGWKGLRFAKVCKACRPHTMNPLSEIDYVVEAEPATPIGNWLTTPTLARLAEPQP